METQGADFPLHWLLSVYRYLFHRKAIERCEGKLVPKMWIEDREKCRNFTMRNSLEHTTSTKCIFFQTTIVKKNKKTNKNLTIVLPVAAAICC